MYNCENCNNDHDGSFGSGRFCSSFCANSFSTKNIVGQTKIIYCSSCNEGLEVLKRSRSKNVICAECKEQTKQCKHCGELFKTTEDYTFCSRKCSGTFNFIEGGKKFRSTMSSEDWSIMNKLAYIEGKNYVAGGKTKWYNYGNIRVQGSYELRACFIFDKMKELNLIKDWEYTKDKIPYVDVDGSKRTYFLDFKIFNHDRSFYYVETKGYNTPTDFCKWKSAKDKNLNLVVWYDEELLEFENKYL